MKTTEYNDKSSALAWNILTCMATISSNKAYEYEYNMLNIMCKMKKVSYCIICTFGIATKLRNKNR